MNQTIKCLSIIYKSITNNDVPEATRKIYNKRTDIMLDIYDVFMNCQPIKIFLLNHSAINSVSIITTKLIWAVTAAQLIKKV